MKLLPTVCRIHQTPLVMTLAGVAGHCRQCEREAQDVIATTAPVVRLLSDPDVAKEIYTLD